ncbi:hypothetical protein BDP81DRAFT_450045 [Colletotrichum phormii]|uniref:Uncharacterized protein n=1 Tax=Colletotrichum phormii TaxID=359342 RepID=A0AAI9ZQ23_9PEZI|nr:uncharacterized protein BDP81DRAFT_450045 [Colletotrichum phormii]KAK1636102.1 hypothetical protein BDP81DRAFT_450045 [Colletotrichum phormii]
MEKVWFKLRQTDYPPPEIKSMGTGSETAPLCLGHFVPNLRRLDFPINRHDIEPFPRSMPVYSTNALTFSWKDGRAVEYGGVLGGGAPVLAAAGVPVTAKADVKAIFKDSVSNCEKYERLDTYLIQVTKAYIADCLERDTVAKYVEDSSTLGAWSAFVITGLKIARAGSRSTSSSHGIEYGFGVEAELPAIASIRAEPNVARSKDMTTAAEKQSDFVWAIRLAKVRKGILMKDWSVGPYTNKATFNDREDEVDVEQIVSAEGVTPTRVLEDAVHDEAFVILPEQDQS